MDKAGELLRTFAHLLTVALDAILVFLAHVERWFHAQLFALRITPQAETVILLFAFLVLLVIVARVFAGLVRLLLGGLLLALMLDILVPALQR